MPQKPSDYVKSYDWQTKWMHFLIEDDDLLEKYNTIWYKADADINKECDAEPVYKNNFLKTKIKPAMVSCSRFVWFANSSDHMRV